MINTLVSVLEYPAVRRFLLFLFFLSALLFFDLSFQIAVGIAIGLTLNVVLVALLPFRTQVLIFFSELLCLFLAFFYSFDLSFSFIIERLPLLILTGLGYTLLITSVSIICASILAMVGALARLSKNGPAYSLSTFYVSFFRGTPLLLQVYLIYLGLPQMGITLDAIPSGIIALSLCYGAYMTEIFRSGIQSVGEGQAEAATALGLKKWQVMYKVILPQAIRIIVPPTGNNFISMLKDSSLVSAMGVMELMYLARTLGRSEFKHFEMLITAALIYWFVSFLFELLQARIEKYYGRYSKT
ncbi:amino acid ABC transporter permease [uncultured Kiloniella sp.]|uniref:amino acid ABC transporter permease n=1 Tax=Kiloniella sp. TaxID=1938587 RepID=UPI00260AB8DA|nr:amino acid ABC transporter permease [uncultured Kiloniella sp.]